jgi:hypothetical protein
MSARARAEAAVRNNSADSAGKSRTGSAATNQICSSCRDRRLIDTVDCSGRIFSRVAAADAILAAVRGR